MADILLFLTKAGSSQHLSLLAQDVLQMMSNICSWNCKHTHPTVFTTTANKTFQNRAILQDRYRVKSGLIGKIWLFHSLHIISLQLCIFHCIRCTFIWHKLCLMEKIFRRDTLQNKDIKSHQVSETNVTQLMAITQCSSWKGVYIIIKVDIKK